MGFRTARGVREEAKSAKSSLFNADIEMKRKKKPRARSEVKWRSSRVRGSFYTPVKLVQRIVYTVTATTSILVKSQNRNKNRRLASLTPPTDGNTYSSFENPRIIKVYKQWMPITSVQRRCTSITSCCREDCYGMDRALILRVPIVAKEG